MLSFQYMNFRYDPYPIGYARPVFEDGIYQQLVKSWPPTEIFNFAPGLGNKYFLNESKTASAYRDFLRSCEPWRRFYRYVKSREFITDVLQMLEEHWIRLHLPVKGTVNGDHLSNWWCRANGMISLLKRHLWRKQRLGSRFEFSMMPSRGGCIKPHTDAPTKHVTLVLSMTEDGEWDPDWGGGTAVLRPKDITRNYNYVNKQMGFDEVETVDTFPFGPNQCVLFIKTFNSLHGVHEMSAPKDAWRKTLTINIESRK